jgi:hypothetical protein
MAKVRQVQHRPERETARGRELAEARREIKQLKRLVARLQKTIKRIEEQRSVQAEASPESLAEAEVAASVPVAIEQSDKDKCLDCGSTSLVRFMTPGGKELIFCKNCKARR